jgi:hypothetical protein
LPAISETDARKWLRLESLGSGVTDADSELIQMCVTSAVGTFERFTGLQIMEATYTWIVSCFPISIEKAPNVQNILIEYKTDKMATTWTTLDTTKYQFYQEGFRQNSIQYATDITTITPEIVKVTFKVGYDNANKIPADWLMPIRAILADVWDNRADGVREKISFSEKLMMNYAVLAVR